MFHKPCGCVTARKDTKHPTVMDYFRELGNDTLSPVGRLDKETEGFLIVTDDGGFNQQMTHPDYQKEKVYEFIALGELTEEKIDTLRKGVQIAGAEQKTAPCKIKVTKTDVLQNVLPILPEEIQRKSRHNRGFHPVAFGEITICEGKKRQIRRMLKTVRCLVLYLKRVEIDGVRLDENLKPGEWKEINPGELWDIPQKSAAEK